MNDFTSISLPDGGESQDDIIRRLMTLVPDRSRPGSGVAALEGGRGDEFGFAALEAVVAPIHPDLVAPLHALLDSRRLKRGSAEVSKCLMVRVAEFALKSDIDPCDCTSDEVLDFLQAYRDGGGVNGGMMSAGSCRNAVNIFVTLHLVARNGDPRLLGGPRSKLEIHDLLAGFAKEDESFSGGRPGVVGVRRRRMPPAIGYDSSTPINMGHVARMNVRLGGRVHRLYLREQARSLLIRETHVDTDRLALLRPGDVETGAEPEAWIAARADGTGDKLRHPISRPLARTMRLLIDDVTAHAGGPPWPDAIIFQGVMGTGCRSWTGTPAVTNTQVGLRTFLLAAADQARVRRENDVGSPEEVARFVERLTYESIRDGLLADAHAAGVPPVPLAVFLRKQRLVEIDNYYRLQDRRRGKTPA